MPAQNTAKHAVRHEGSFQRSRERREAQSHLKVVLGPVAARAERHDAFDRGTIREQRRVALVGNLDQIDIRPPRDHLFHAIS